MPPRRVQTHRSRCGPGTPISRLAHSRDANREVGAPGKSFRAFSAYLTCRDAPLSGGRRGDRSFFAIAMTRR